MNPSKLKVVELRAELASRGLDTKGNKAALVDRLQEALDKESGTVTERKPQEDSDEAGDNTVSDTLNTSQPESNPDESDSEPAKSAPVSEAVDQNQQSQEEENSREEPEQRKSSLGGKEQDNTASEEPETCRIKKESVESNHHQEKDSENTKMDVDGEKEIKKEGFESEIKTEPRIKSENDIKEERDVKEERDYGRDDRKRKRSSSPKRDFSRPSKEDEPEYNDNDVVLSWYDSDLNLIVEKNGFLKACPMTTGGFGFIWAGVRGTFGYTSGNLCYQVKLTEYCDVSHLENEPTPNVLRVGWSALGTSLQLGEEPLSYGFGGTGKIAVNCKFRDYGKPFGLNDIVTAYISFNNGEISMSYAVNQDFLGEAFRVNESELKGKALAPHILSKNVRFEVNFGQEEPWVPVRDGYSFVNTVPSDQAVPGPRRPEKRGECEMIMMCGLPGCGKTYWANKHVAENPDKLYNILGTNALIDKMKLKQELQLAWALL